MPRAFCRNLPEAAKIPGKFAAPYCPYNLSSTFGTIECQIFCITWNSLCRPLDTFMLEVNVESRFGVSFQNIPKSLNWDRTL
jgi:hypothetical protein